MTAALSVYSRLFAHRGFSLVYLAYAVSRLGDWIYLVGFSLWLLELTGSPLIVATVVAAGTLPRVLLGMVFGTVADRVDRVSLMIGCDLLRAVVLVPLLFVRGRSDLWLVYSVVFILSALSAQFSVCRGPLLTLLLPPGELLSGNSLFSGTDSVITIAGPAVAAALMARYGYGAAFVVNAISFLLSASLLMPLLWRLTSATTEVAAAKMTPFRTAASESVQFILAPGPFRRLLWVVALVALGQGAVNALHAPLVMQVFHATKEKYALVLTLQGVGGILGAYAVAQAARRLSPNLLLAIGAAATALSTAVYVSVPVFPLLILCTMLEGVLFTGVIVAIPTMVQRLAPTERMGRAFGAVDSVENGTMLVAMGTSGVLASVTSVRAVFGCVAALFALAAWAGATNQQREA